MKLLFHLLTRKIAETTLCLFFTQVRAVVAVACCPQVQNNICLGQIVAIHFKIIVPIKLTCVTANADATSNT